MKFKIFALWLNAFVIATTALAQPVIGLQKTIGGSLEDNFTCMSFAKDSGFIIGGYSNSNTSGNKLENSKGSYDFWIVLLNKKGAIMGQKTIGGSNADFLEAIQPTTDGGYILGGYSWSDISGDKTQNSKGYDDYWVVKLDSYGNIQWDKTLGGNVYDELQTIKQTNDGGYIVGGYSSSNISGDKTQNSRGGNDYWVVKLDGNGNIQWDKTIGGSSTDQLYDIIQTNDNGYLLGGYSYSGISGEKTESSRGLSDYWIVKLDNAGNIQWDKTIGGNLFDQLSAIAQTGDGGYLLGGNSSSDKSGEKKQSSRGNDDYWIVKTDNLGQVEWSKTYGGNGYDYLTSLELTSDGGYMLGGYSTSNISGEKKENSRGLYDYWIVKLNRSGKIQWDKTIGGMQSEGQAKTKEIGRNRYIVAGYSYSGISGDKTEDNKGTLSTPDYWLVELKYSNPDSITAVWQNKNDLQVNTDKSNSGFSVYPNPATNVLHIKSTGKVSFSLSDQAGKVFLIKTIVNAGDIDVSKVPPGVYFLSNNTIDIKQKIIINR